MLARGLSSSAFGGNGRGDGSFRWADNNARKVGVGWNVKQLSPAELFDRL
jgi:hypothetical protein